MRRKKRTEVTIESHRVVVISGRRPQTRVWCDSCGGPVVMVTVDDAAIFARVSSRTIYGWVQAGWLHCTETTDGLLLVCLNSISSAGVDGRGRT